MKIRTDFVTNSSSSSFTLSYTFELKSGEKLCFSDGGNADFADYACVIGEVSPRELGLCKSVNEMIKLLQDRTKAEIDDDFEEDFEEDFDGDYDSCLIRILQDGALLERGKPYQIEEATDFIAGLRAIKSMGDIRAIRVDGEKLGHNGEEYRIYTCYELDTGKYTYIHEGVNDEDIYEEGNGGHLSLCDLDYANEPSPNTKFTIAKIRLSASSRGRIYDYICDIKGVKTGDSVLIEGQGDQAFTVLGVEEVLAKDLLLPYKRYKRVLKIIG